MFKRSTALFVALLAVLLAMGGAAALAAEAPTSATAITDQVGSPPATALTVSLLVKFKASASAADINAAVHGLGGSTARSFDQLRTRVITVPAGAADRILAAFATHPLVEHAAATVRVRKAGDPSDPSYAQQWALPKIAWDQAYANVPISGSATIAVLDTGIDASHPDLAGRVALGASFTGGDPNVDPNGHGTALAGIAAANVNDGIGMAGVGYAGVSVTSVQVLGADGTGTDADVVAGVLWAADNGVQVILMGFSSADYSFALADAVNYAWAHGAVLVAATGNDGSSGFSYPAGMSNVIGVAATDENDAIAAGSNTGSASVAAPGVGILATAPGGGYSSITGTSASAAEAAGLAALLRANGATNAEASSELRAGSDALSGSTFGRINVASSFTADATLPSTAGTTAGGVVDPTYTAAAASIGGVSVAAQSGTLTYGTVGSATFVITVNKLLNGILKASLSATGLPAGATTSFSSNPASAGGGTDPTSTLTVTTSVSTPAGTTSFTVKAVNDAVPANSATNTGSLTVGPAPLTITANDATKTYGDTTVFAGTAFSTGLGQLKNGDTVTSVTLTSPGAAATAAVGSYAIVPSAAVGTGLGNYTISYADGSLTVSPRPITVKANDVTRVYGDSTPAFSIALASGTLGSSDTLSSLGTPTYVTDPTNPAVNVGTYKITVSGLASSNYTISYTSGTARGTLTITVAPATVAYTGPNMVSTGSPTNTTAQVTVSATVTVTGGDITTAKVTFTATPFTGTPIVCGPANVGMVTATTGTAVCTFTAPASSTGGGTTYVVTTAIGGSNYAGPSDVGILNVYIPLLVNFITGGGYVNLTNSAGSYNGDTGTKNNFGFNVKYNKSGTNLQGQANIIVRRSVKPDGQPCVSVCIYQYKANALSNLTVTPDGTQASFTSKANFQWWDALIPGVVNPGTGNLLLQVTLTDGSPDTIGIAILDVNNSLLYSSNWIGTPPRTTEQALGGGSLQVH